MFHQSETLKSDMLNPSQNWLPGTTPLARHNPQYPSLDIIRQTPPRLCPKNISNWALSVAPLRLPFE